MKTPQQYKELTIKEFTRAADIYETDNAGIHFCDSLVKMMFVKIEFKLVTI